MKGRVKTYGLCAGIVLTTLLSLSWPYWFANFYERGQAITHTLTTFGFAAVCFGIGLLPVRYADVANRLFHRLRVDTVIGSILCFLLPAALCYVLTRGRQELLLSLLCTGALLLLAVREPVREERLLYSLRYSVPAAVVLVVLGAVCGSVAAAGWLLLIYAMYIFSTYATIANGKLKKQTVYRMLAAALLPGITALVCICLYKGLFRPEEAQRLLEMWQAQKTPDIHSYMLWAKAGEQGQWICLSILTMRYIVYLPLALHIMRYPSVGKSCMLTILLANGFFTLVSFLFLCGVLPPALLPGRSLCCIPAALLINTLLYADPKRRRGLRTAREPNAAGKDSRQNAKHL